MRINKKQYNKLREKVEALEKALNGGKGSGNFGHAGRPGAVGGSGNGQGKTVAEKEKGEGSLRKIEGKLTETGKRLSKKIKEIDDTSLDDINKMGDRAWTRKLRDRDNLWDEYDSQAIEWMKKNKKLQKQITSKISKITGVKGIKLTPYEGERSGSVIFNIDMGGQDVFLGKKRFPKASGSITLYRLRTASYDEDGVNTYFTAFIRSKRGKLGILCDITRESSGKTIIDSDY